MKYHFLHLIFFSTCLIRVAETRNLVNLNDNKVHKYIQKYQHLAIIEMDRMGIPASIKMGQGILESGSGQSQLAKNANNHFGIKCGGDWEGESYYAWDDEEEKSCFRVFETAEACFIAHSEFLTNPKKTYRYGFLFKLEKTDYKGWANGLQKAGYSSSKTYAKKLISVIERYELYKLDYLTAEIYVVSDEELEREFGVNKGRAISLFDRIREQSKDTVEKNDVATILIPDPLDKKPNIDADSLTQKIFKLNKLNAVFVQANDDLVKLAKRYKQNVRRLRRYNELTADKPLKQGEHVFLQRKNKKYLGLRPTHLSREGETLWDISQRYGLRLKYLERLNPKYKKKTPPRNTRIILRR